jgi:hypothetical protein
MSKLVQAAVGVVLVLLGAGVVTAVVMHEDWITKPKLRVKLVAKFKDPSSLQFQHESVTATGWLCGEVNAKNSYGAYGGFTRFVTNGYVQTYIDRAEFVNTDTAADLISILDKQNAMLEAVLAQRRARPDVKIPAPSQPEMIETAWKEIFAEQWKKICS